MFKLKEVLKGKGGEFEWCSEGEDKGAEGLADLPQTQLIRRNSVPLALQIGDKTERVKPGVDVGFQKELRHGVHFKSYQYYLAHPCDFSFI